MCPATKWQGCSGMKSAFGVGRGGGCYGDGSAGSGRGEHQTGMASYYKSGKRTANGERFNPHRLYRRPPHPALWHAGAGDQSEERPSVIVRINDRGPFMRGRVIDLSLGAARVVGLTASGVAKVKVVPLELRSAGAELLHFRHHQMHFPHDAGRPCRRHRSPRRYGRRVPVHDRPRRPAWRRCWRTSTSGHGRHRPGP